MRIVNAILKRNRKEIEQITSVSERHYEYPFAVSCLNGMKLKSDARILDIGCSGSPLPLMMSAMGYHVTGSDRNLWPVQCDGFEMVVDDIKRSNFATESFDVITLISVIEHIGTPRYGEAEDSVGHLKAMREMHRILKPSGYLVLTTPYGIHGINSAYHFRVHDMIDLAAMTAGFDVERMSFIAAIHDPNVFEPCTESQAMEVGPLKDNPGRHATILMLLRKEGDK